MKIASAAIALALMAVACADSGPEPEVQNRPSPAPPSERAAGNKDVLHFAAIGDFGSGTAEQSALGQQMCAWRADHPFDLVVTTGDNIYEVGHPDRFQPAFFEPYACLLDDGVRFRATLGNHDVLTDGGRPELNEPAFGMPSKNYVVRNRGVRFVMVNSNDLRYGWLKTNLKPRSGDRWTIVVFHHPVYSSGAHGSTEGFRPTLPRIFRKHGVDLVLNGHDHNYEVTKRLKGIRYVITGGGGASLRPCSEPEWFTAKCVSKYHFLYVRAGRERIKVKAIGLRGQVLHEFRTRGRS